MAGRGMVGLVFGGGSGGDGWAGGRRGRVGCTLGS